MRIYYKYYHDIHLVGYNSALKLKSQAYSLYTICQEILSFVVNALQLYDMNNNITIMVF